MTDLTHTTSEEPLKDRKKGLIVFGVLQVALGGLCALFVPLMLAGAALSKAAGGQQTDLKMLVPGLCVYALGAAWFITLGVGSMLARRWARALIVASSWLWLVCGASGLLLTWIILPDMFKQMGTQNQIPAALLTAIKVFTLGFMAILYVALPASLALFYGSPHVKATCESRNPAPAWTDACPLPVLGVCLLFGIWTLSMPSVGCYGWAMPFFGIILSGPAGAAVALATAALSAYIAWGSYRLDRRAWACSVGMALLWALSVGITFSRHSLFDFYATMNMPKEQLELIKTAWETHASLFAWFCGLWFAALLGYLGYTGRYYPPAPENTVN